MRAWIWLKSSSATQVILNVAAIVALIVCCGYVASDYLSGKQQVSQLPTMKPGTLVTLPQSSRGASGGRTAQSSRGASSGRTIVLALQVGCAYCEASVPLYRDLLAAANKTSAYNVVAVFPQAGKGARGFLKARHLNIADVRQADFGTIHIEGTPTVLILDAGSHLVAEWDGRLNESQESDLFQKLALTRIRQPNIPIETTDDSSIPGIRSAELLADLDNSPVVDVRPRGEFSQYHLTAAVNIPLQELEVRAVHELPKDRAVVMYCGTHLACELDKAKEGVSTYCTESLKILRLVGFDNVLLFKDDISKAQEAKLPITWGLLVNETPITRSR
jgi:Rhodanese-like domain